MGAARYLAAGEWRSRRVGTIVLAVVLGVAGALSMAGFAVARRGPDAYRRLIVEARMADGTVQLGGVEDVGPQLDRLMAAADADDDVVAWSAGAFGYERTPEGEFYGGIVPVAGDEIEMPAVVEGRLPAADEPYELAVSRPLADGTGLGVGDTIDIGVFTRAQTDALANGSDEAPGHGVHTFTVVGVTVGPWDIGLVPAEDEGLGGLVLWSPGLWREYDGDLSTYGAGVAIDVRAGTDAGQVVERLASPFGPSAFALVGSDVQTSIDKVWQSVGAQANGVRAFAFALTVASLVVGGQALRRQVRSGLVAHPALPGLGFSRRGLGVAAAVWAAGVAGIAAAVGLVGAALLSPLGPLGVARDAELHPGVRLDPLVLAAGVGVVLVVVPVASVAAAVIDPRAGQRWQHRPVAVAAAAPTPGATVGVLLAASHTRLGSRTRTSVGALGLAFAAVAGVIAFGASLDRATTDPAAYGWTWDVTVAECASPACAADAASRLDDDRDVAAWSGVATTTDSGVVGIDHPVEAALVQPGQGWTAGAIVEGRAPADEAEVVLGRGTARDAGVAIGDTVELVIVGSPPSPFRVVGYFVPPAPLFEDSPLDQGMAATRSAVQVALGDDGAELLDQVPSQWFLVDLSPAVDRTAALARLDAAFPNTLALPSRPDRLESAYRLRFLPVLLAALVGLFGFGGLLHVASISLFRRRAMLATLRALGFLRRQVRTVVGVELLLVGAATAMVFVPLGVAGGRFAWGAARRGLGSVAPPTAPLAWLALAAAGGVVVAWAVGQGAGAVASRRRPAAGLRAPD